MNKSLRNSNCGRIAWLVFAICLFSGMAIIESRAQSNSDQSSIPKRGYQASSTYALGDLETINTTNGNLLFRIPLAELPPGRGGLKAGVSLFYNSKLYDRIPRYYYCNQEAPGANTPGNPGVDPPSSPFPECNGEPEARIRYYVAGRSSHGGWRYGYRYTLVQDDNAYYLTRFNPDYNACNDMEAMYHYRMKVIFPDGSEHQLTLQGGATDVNNYARYDFNGRQNPMCPSAPNWPGSTMSYYTTDGTYARLEVTLDSDTDWINNAWTLYLPDGSRVTGVGPGNLAAERIYDRNDNYIEIQEVADYNGTGHQATIMTDQLGRLIVVEKNATANEDYVRVQGVGGAWLTTTVKWKMIMPRKSYVVRSGSMASLFGFVRVVDRITLPMLPSQTAPLKYTFGYNAESGNPTYGWGEVSSVLLPTGALAEYTYALDGLTGSSVNAADVFHNSPTQKDITYDLEYDLTTSASTETTSYDIDQVNGESTITAPDGGVTTQYFTPILDEPASSAGAVRKIVGPDGTITEQLWSYAVPVGLNPGVWSDGNRYLKAEVTTLVDYAGNPAKISMKKFTHNKNGNIVSTEEYDFVQPGSITIPRDSNGYLSSFPTGLTPARVTVTGFANPGSDADALSAGSNDYYEPGAPNLLSAPSWTEIRSGSGTPFGRNEFYYDGAAVLSASPTHGNVTKQMAWDSYKGGIYRTYSNPLTTTNSNSVLTSFNSYGMPTLTTDPNGIQTQITYGYVAGPSGNVTDLYPTQTIKANNTSVAQTAAATYDFYTGLITAATDVDNNVTTVTAYDDFGRLILTKVAYGTPVETRTTIEYGDLERRVITRSDLNVAGDGKLVSIQHFDQLGRVRLARTLEDAGTQSAINEEAGIKVQTRYGIVNSSGGHLSYQIVSNPYSAARSIDASGEETMGWTRTITKANGNRSEVETFSGAAVPVPSATGLSSTGTVVNLRDANQSYVRDQADKWRMSEINALGQLTGVIEDPSVSIGGFSYSGTNVLTTYEYDTSSNLTDVHQGYSGGEQHRQFLYSSLGRLVSASNPESGTISYRYDPNGNVTHKADARGITTDFAYDALNRPAFRDYSDATPDVTYTYDSGNVPYGKGRLTSVSANLGNENVSTTGYLSYDPTGRVLSSTQTTEGLTHCSGSSPTCEMSYKYNLAGALTEETYPSGRIVRHNYTADGKLAAVSSRAVVNRQFKSYAQAFSYNAFGAIIGMQLGNMRWESTKFNPRLQPTQIALGTTPGASNILDLDYTYGTTGNNGSVLTQTISVPSVGITPGFVAEQTYTYDQLNRLKSSTELSTLNGGSPSQSWKQTYHYDRFGNRSFDTTSGATTTIPGGCSPNLCNPTFNLLNNRFADGLGYGYDSAGNVTQDAEGKQFAYDAENKQKSFGVGGSSSNGGTYVYDGAGRRVKTVVGTKVTIFVYNSAGKMVAEYSTTAPTSQQVNYLTADTLGSPRINTDAAGAVIARHDYMPFGEEILGIAGREAAIGYGPDEVPQRFTGKERDIESGLDYFMARYYSARFGRFTSPDEFAGGPEPACGGPCGKPSKALAYSDIGNPQSLNKYQYTYNSPLVMVDPDGHCPLIPFIIGGAAVAACIFASPDTTNAPRLNDKFYKSGDSVNLVIFNGALDVIGSITIKLIWRGGAALAGKFAVPTAIKSVWDLAPTLRGRAIEEVLAKTEYANWHHVGAEGNGTFPMFDFQQGLTLVSLKTVDAASSSAISRMQSVIRAIGGSGASVGDLPTSFVLDIRTKVGQSKLLEPLIKYGEKHGVSVKISEVR